jgi:ionotropic glutamate receptor NMDA 1
MLPHKMTSFRFKLQVTLIIVFVSVEQSRSNASQGFTIGAMLSSPNAEQIFDEAVKEINNSSVPLSAIRLNSSSSVLSSNPIRSALDVCERVISNHVYVMLVSHAKGQTNPPIAVSYACGFYRIPVIGITARESIFSDKVC